MEKTLLTVLVLCTTCFINAQQLKINVEITNIQKGKGNIVVQVYDKKESFLKKPYLTKIQKASQTILTFQLELLKGGYAIIVYQDLDNNGKLKKNWLGIPSEPVGNSTNFKPDGSAPTFNDCAVLVQRNESIITIDLE